MLGQFAELIGYFDSAVQSTVNENERQKLLYDMFLIECKFNLDILDAINYKNATKAKDEIAEIVNLLSFECLLATLKYEKNSSSFITSKLTERFNGNESKNMDLQKFAKEDEKLMALYKRIIVLKALSSISANNDLLRKVNFKTRLKNLKRLLLLIIKG